MLEACCAVYRRFSMFVLPPLFEIIFCKMAFSHLTLVHDYGHYPHLCLSWLLTFLNHSFSYFVFSVFVSQSQNVSRFILNRLSGDGWIHLKIGIKLYFCFVRILLNICETKLATSYMLAGRPPAIHCCFHYNTSSPI